MVYSVSSLHASFNLYGQRQVPALYNEMTAISSVAPTSLGELKFQRDTSRQVLAKMSVSERGAVEAQSMDVAVRAFTEWFQRQRRLGGVAMPGDGVLDVQPNLSREFCIGLHGMRYFIGVPKDCMPWFAELPWSHVEVAASCAVLSLKCGRSSVARTLLPAFSLNFEVQPASYTQALLHYHFLDVRAIEKVPTAGGPFEISREVYVTLSVAVTHAKTVSGYAGPALDYSSAHAF